jgi:hypothetical protein
MAKRRGNGEGTIAKVKNGWKAVVTLSYQGGKRATKSKTTKSRADAVA